MDEDKVNAAMRVVVAGIMHKECMEQFSVSHRPPYDYAAMANHFVKVIERDSAYLLNCCTSAA